VSGREEPGAGTKLQEELCLGRGGGDEDIGGGGGEGESMGRLEGGVCQYCCCLVITKRMKHGNHPECVFPCCLLPCSQPTCLQGQLLCSITG
jgi:hypothetical protein